MLRDELLAQTIVRSASSHNFERWADTLTEYAACLETISTRVSPDECARLVNVGSMFYR
jgi:hypothetical protein